MAPTSRSPDRGSIQQVAIKALQTRSVSVERLDGSVFRTFRLQPAADYYYILRSRPSSRVRLLRHEEERLLTEASTLQVLRGRLDILVPRLIEYHSTTTSIGSPYLISGPFKGSILSDVEPLLSREALTNIDMSLAQVMRQASQINGPGFGDIRQSGSLSSSWSKCFSGMVESILRDAEDALVNLPYDIIRDQLRRHRHTLDQITRPRLCLVEMYSDKKILADTSTCTVSGLLDFSTAMWGDPFLSDCFYQSSRAFMEGWGTLPNRTVEERIRQYL